MHGEIKKEMLQALFFCITSEVSTLCTDWSTQVPNKRGKVYAEGKREEKKKKV